MAPSEHFKDKISDKTRKKIADEELRYIIKIAYEHRKTLSELAKH